MNITFMIGNLVKAPEKVEGFDLARFTLAVSANYTKEDGTRPVEFFKVVAWNKLAENCLKYLTKGSRVGVCGKMQNRQYTTSTGEERSVTELVASEIEFLNIKKEDDAQQLEPIDDGDLPF